MVRILVFDKIVETCRNHRWKTQEKVKNTKNVKTIGEKLRKR